MYPEILPALRCPACAAVGLTLADQHSDRDEIVAGRLQCSACGADSTIHDGIWDALGAASVPRTPAQLTNYLPLAARVYEPGWRWLALTLLSGRRFPLREELTLLRGLLRPHAGRVYLDIACSAGLYARALAGDGAIIAGIDHSWAMLREARRLALRHDLRISYIRASAQHLPLADGSAAGVAMGGSLNEIGDQLAALREMRRTLAPDGRCFLMSLSRANSPAGRLLQRLLGTGGIIFPAAATLEGWLDTAQLRPRARWHWRVVMIMLSEPQLRTSGTRI